MRYNITMNTPAKNAFFLIFFPGLIAVIIFASFLTLAPSAAQAQTMQCNTAAEKVACQTALNQALADEAAAQAQLIAGAIERHGLLDTGIRWTVAASGWKRAWLTPIATLFPGQPTRGTAFSGRTATPSTTLRVSGPANVA